MALLKYWSLGCESVLINVTLGIGERNISAADSMAKFVNLKSFDKLVLGHDRTTKE